MTEVGQKFDKDKPRVDLIDPQFIHSLASVLTMGANKYGPNNWQHVEHAEERYLAALYRHILAYHSGEQLDEESELSHLHHAAANLMFLAFLEEQKTNKNREFMQEVKRRQKAQYGESPGQGGCGKDAQPIQEYFSKQRGPK